MFFKIICFTTLGFFSFSSLAAEKKGEEHTSDDHWVEKIWEWADEFDIPADQLPRNKQALLAERTLIFFPYSNRKKITYLPAEIGRLTNLQQLSFARNHLEHLPAEIGNLSNLEVLDLAENKLQSLPAEIGNLSKLQELYLFDNQLQSLPTEIGHLTNLKVLSLAGNKLQNLPEEIGNLSNLQKLWLGSILWGNHLQSLPISFTQLQNLEDLSIKKNPNLKLTTTQENFISKIRTVWK